MQGEVKSWLGLAAAVQFTLLNILSSPYLLCVISSVRPPNYNTSLLLCELMVTPTRPLPDCVGPLRKVSRGRCLSDITRFSALHVQGTTDCIGRLTPYYAQSSQWSDDPCQTVQGETAPNTEVSVQGMLCTQCQSVL